MTSQSPLDKSKHTQDPEHEHQTPRWVYLFGLIALIIVVIFVLLHLSGGGFRGHL